MQCFRNLYLFLPLLLSASSTVCQGKLAFIKSGLRHVNIYDSAKQRIITSVDNEEYFYCNNLVGNWYSYYDPESFIHKDSVQFFDKLTLQQQRDRINKVLKKFYSVCNVDTPEISVIDVQFRRWDTIFKSPRDVYYDKAFYPILDNFYEYYKKTKDTVTLLNVMNSVTCGPDGEFSETLFYLVGQCYDLDKQLLIRQIKRIHNIVYKNRLKNALLRGMYFYIIKLGKKKRPHSEIQKFLDAERKHIIGSIN